MMAGWAAAQAPAAGTPLLLRDPSLSRTQIAFAFGGSLWTVGRNGGTAVRLTAGPGIQSNPIFSPDGTQIAFTGEYDGNTDVFVVAATGGDAMPWMFREAKVGALVGTRTWGGLVGIGGYPVLMDGGTVTAPREAFYNMRGEWDVENHGVDPDYAVDLDPNAWRQGHDPQLEKAVAVAMEQLREHPRVIAKVPPYPNYHQRFGAPATAAGANKAASGGGGGGH